MSRALLRADRAALRPGWREGLALLFLVHSVIASALFGSVLAGVRHPDYGEARVALAFEGLRIRDLAARIDAALPPEQPIALGPALRESDFLVQRLTEGLYPRAIDARASVRLDARLASDRGGAAAGDLPVARFREAELFLQGPFVPTHVPREVVAAPIPAWSTPLWAGAIASVLGLGLALLPLLGRGAPVAAPLRPAAAVLLAALALGLHATLATVLQRPLGARALPWIGLACVAGVGARAAIHARGHAPLLISAARRALHRPERWLLAALVAALFFRAATSPISMWDGRSIWLFQAARLSAHGFVPLADLLHADVQWSHPDYPLLFPALLAGLSALRPAFDERLAATAIPLLLAACLTALWFLARRRLGRAAGAAFTLGLALSLDRVAGGGYADGFVVLLLLVEVLAFASHEHRRLGWFAAACASLLKSEGILYALPVALLFAWRGGADRSWRRLAPLVALVPGPLYALWTRAHGVDSILQQKSLAAVAAELPGRFVDALAAAPALLVVPGYTGLRGLLVDGLLALLWIVVLGFARRTTLHELRPLLAIAALWIGIAFAAVSVPPQEVGWFVHTALDRLLAAPAALLVLAALVQAGSAARPGAERVGETPPRSATKPA